MSLNNKPIQWLRASVLAAGLLLAQPASAQLFFDWGGQEKVNDSGRLFVRINADHKPGEIIVSFSDRKLYYFTAPGMAVSYPIAIPREQDRWEGKTSVTQKRENPSWTPTPSMIKENPKLPRWVPGGHPMNPLGNRALYLGSSMYRIHGTDAPWTIGTAVSKGCIRMYNKDALDVYERSKVGAKVLVTWKAYQFTPVEGQENIAQALAQQQAQQQGQQPNQQQTAVQPAAAAAAGFSAPAQPAEARRARSDTARIFDNSGAEDFSARRTRRPKAEIEPDLSAGPQPSSASVSATLPAAEAPPTDRAQRNRDQQRRDASRDPSSRQKRNDGTASSPRRDRTASTPATEPAPAALETGSLTESQPAATETPRPAPVRATPAPTPARAQVPAPTAAAASSASGDDTAARMLQAAERAAAAAERAAAAAERAERAAKAVPAPAAPTGGGD